MDIKDLIFELAKKGISTKVCFDSDKNKIYFDLDTMAKSHLYLYEDGTIVGRYDYENKIDFNQNVDSILIDLCNEFNNALHGRSFGNEYWFDLCREFNVKCETYF